MIKCIRTVLFLLLSVNLEASSPRADVLNVTTTGANSSYMFSVTLKSDETGCQQYANWWEILSVDGELLYRRILVHSHPNTQPFTRKGSKVHLNKEDTVYIRGHMNKLGYIGDVFKGSVKDGFSKVHNYPSFSKNLEITEPLPSECLY